MKGEAVARRKGDYRVTPTSEGTWKLKPRFTGGLIVTSVREASQSGGRAGRSIRCPRRTFAQ